MTAFDCAAFVPLIAKWSLKLKSAMRGRHSKVTDHKGRFCPSATRRGTTAELIEEIFEAFDAADLKYCVLRNYEKLTYDHGNDLDVLIHPKDCKKAHEIIQGLATQLLFEKIGERKHLAVHKVYLSTLIPGHRCLVIDLVRHISWKGIPCAAVDYILEHRAKKDNFWIPSPGTEAATLFIKELLMFGTVKKRNNARSRIKSLAKIGHYDFVACLAPSFGRRVTEWLLQQAQQGNWEAIQHCYKKLRWSATWRTFLRNPLVQMLQWARFLWGHVHHKIKRPLGMSVALLGPDGSGKTTIAEGLNEFWESNFSQKSVNIHGNFKVLPELKNVRRLWAKIRRKPMEPDIDFTKRHSGAFVEPHSLIGSLCYICYYIWDYILGHFVIFFHKGNDRLIVADRYFYEYFYQLGNSNLPHWLLHLLRRVIPQPDLIVYLDRDPKSIYKGKDELTLDEIERQQAVLSKLVKEIPFAVRINGDDGIKATIQRIERLMVERMAERNT